MAFKDSEKTVNILKLLNIKAEKLKIIFLKTLEDTLLKKFTIINKK